MTSTKLYKVNKRPRDALSDDEDVDNEHKNDNQYTSKLQKSQNSMSILLWLDQNWRHFIGFLGQQSYSFATPQDVIVAYNYLNMDKDWFLWLLNINKLSPTQFLWVQGKSSQKDTDIEKNECILKQISMIINQKLTTNPAMQIYMKPFKTLPETETVINIIKSNISKNELKNNIITYCADKQWADKFANKSCLHRFISSPDKLSLFEESKIFTEVSGLSECKGYICRNKDELLRSYDRLTKEIGRTRVVIKDCFGVSGDDITFYKSKQEIIDNFEWKEQFELIEMEEDLRYNVSEIQTIEFVGISFYDNTVIGGGHEQIIVDDAAWAGTKSYKNKKIEQELIRIATDVMNKIGTKYMGGFDFAIQTFKDKDIKPKIYLIDMNTARYTATAQTFIVMEKFGLHDQYFIRKTLNINENALFKTMLLKENNDLLFDVESKCGVYFHMFGPDCGKSILSIFGNDQENAEDILNKLQGIKSVFS